MSKVITWKQLFLCVVVVLGITVQQLSMQDPAHFTFVQKGDMPIILVVPHGGPYAIPGIPERVKGKKLQT